MIFCAIGAILFIFKNAYAGAVAPATVASYYTVPNTGYYYAGDPITFDGSQSHPTDLISSGITPKWEWNFNFDGVNFYDGTVVTTTSSTILHSFPEDGEYCVAVIYFDDNGTQGNVVFLYITIGPRTAYYYLKDHLGSVRMTVNAQGGVASYDNGFHPAGGGNPFGETMPGLSSDTAIADAKYKYIGVEQDVETGLYAMGARYYDPWSGRFEQTDPLGVLSPGESPYAYSFDNPVAYSDPFGLDTVRWYNPQNGKLFYHRWYPTTVTPKNQGENWSFFSSQDVSFLRHELSQEVAWWRGVRTGANAYVRERLNGERSKYGYVSRAREAADAANEVARASTEGSPFVTGVTNVAGDVLTYAGLGIEAMRLAEDPNYHIGEATFDFTGTVAARAAGSVAGGASGGVVGVGWFYSHLLYQYYAPLFRSIENNNRNINGANQ